MFVTQKFRLSSNRNTCLYIVPKACIIYSCEQAFGKIYKQVLRLEESLKIFFDLVVIQTLLLLAYHLSYPFHFFMRKGKKNRSYHRGVILHIMELLPTQSFHLLPLIYHSCGVHIKAHSGI